MKTSRTRIHDSLEPEPFALQITMLLVKLAVGVMALLAGGVALMNYRILLHSDGQVEFVRKTEWTTADTFRFIPEENAAPVAPASVASAAPAPVIASAPPPPVIASAAPAPVIASVPPASVPPTSSPPAPAPVVIAARPRPVRVAAAVKSEEDEEVGDDPVRTVLSTARPAPVKNSAADECRRIRRTLVDAVERLESDRPGSKVASLSVFDLIRQGYLDQLESCPAQGAYAMQRRGRAIEIRCSVHGN